MTEKGAMELRARFGTESWAKVQELKETFGTPDDVDFFSKLLELGEFVSDYYRKGYKLEMSKDVEGTDEVDVEVLREDFFEPVALASKTRNSGISFPLFSSIWKFVQRLWK